MARLTMRQGRVVGRPPKGSSTARRRLKSCRTNRKTRLRWHWKKAQNWAWVEQAAV